MTSPVTAASWPTTALPTSVRSLTSPSCARSPSVLVSSPGDAGSVSFWVTGGGPLSPVRRARRRGGPAPDHLTVLHRTAGGPHRRLATRFGETRPRRDRHDRWPGQGRVAVAAGSVRPTAGHRLRGLSPGSGGRAGRAPRPLLRP